MVSSKQTQRKPLSQPSSRERGFIVPILLFISCFALYGNTIGNDYALDDDIYTYKNEFIVKGFSGIKDIFDKGSLYGFDKENASQYRPVTLFDFMVETSLFGLHPHVNHFFNVLFFALTVVLLYFFLQKILVHKVIERGRNTAIALAATLLFAFHPIHTEVVANIKSRDEILGFLFGLLSFYFLMLHNEKKKNKYYFFSLAFFILAIFSKENCLTFVIIIPLLLYFFTDSGSYREIKKIVLKTIPYVAAVAFYMFIRSRVLESITFNRQIPVMDNSLLAATNNADSIATSFVLLGKYIYMLFIPYPLSYDYSYNQVPVVSWGNFKPILSLAVCVCLIAYMIWRFRKKSIFSFLIIFFFVTLFLSSNLIIKIEATFAERFLYIPSLSFCIALPILAAKQLKITNYELRINHQIIKLSNYQIIMACLLLIYAIIVIPRNAVWKNNFTLCTSGVTTSPNSGRTHQGLALIYADSAQNAKDISKRPGYNLLAAAEFRRVSQIFTMDPDAFYNMGVYYSGKGYFDSAMQEYKKCLRINPGQTLASNNLAVIYSNLQQYDSALRYFIISYEADTNNLYALNSIAGTFMNEKKYLPAIHYDSLLLKRVPGNVQVQNNLNDAIQCLTKSRQER